MEQGVRPEIVVRGLQTFPLGHRKDRRDGLEEDLKRLDQTLVPPIEQEMVYRGSEFLSSEVQKPPGQSQCHVPSVPGPFSVRVDYPDWAGDRLLRTWARPPFHPSGNSWDWTVLPLDLSSPLRLWTVCHSSSPPLVIMSISVHDGQEFTGDTRSVLSPILLLRPRS